MTTPLRRRVLHAAVLLCGAYLLACGLAKIARPGELTSEATRLMAQVPGAGVDFAVRWIIASEVALGLALLIDPRPIWLAACATLLAGYSIVLVFDVAADGWRAPCACQPWLPIGAGAALLRNCLMTTIVCLEMARSRRPS